MGELINERSMVVAVTVDRIRELAEMKADEFEDALKEIANDPIQSNYKYDERKSLISSLLHRFGLNS